MRNYIPLFYMDTFTYVCLNPDAGWTNRREIVSKPEYMYMYNIGRY